MKTLILFFLFIQGCYFQRESLPEKYNIFLCVGESTMAGVLAPIEQQDSNSRAWLWNDSGWEKADGNLNRYSNIIPYRSDGLSMVNSFAKENARMHRYPYTGVVVNAQAGSICYDWNHGFIGYAIQRAIEAQQNNQGSKIVAVLWHQGANDALNNSNTWIENFRGIRHQVDSLLGYDIPILVGGISTDLPQYISMNDTLRKVDLIHDCYYVSSDSLTTVDGTHFDSPSYRKFGLRYFQKYESIR